MESAELSCLPWVDAVLRGALGASSGVVFGASSLEALSEAYVRYLGAMVLVTDGRRAAGSSREPIDRGRADIVGGVSSLRGGSLQ